MSDSYFAKNKCCDPHPQAIGFCWSADSTYCRTCNRWLEAPKDYILRPILHPTGKCIPICNPVSGPSLKLRDLEGLSDEEIDKKLKDLLKTVDFKN